MIVYSTLPPFNLKKGEQVFSFTGAHVYATEEKAFLISAQHGTTLLLDHNLFAHLQSKDLPEGLQMKLIQRAFATYAQSRRVSRIQEKSCPVFFMIDLTKKCCLGCRYCFRDLEDQTVIDDRILDDICAFILSHCRQHHLNKINIQAWGGEPLMAFDKVSRIHRFFADTEVTAIICVETNGVPLTERMVVELRAMDARVGISIDGTPDLHDTHRPLVNGASSMEHVSRGLKMLHTHGYEGQHQGICVITRKSLGKVDEIVDYFVDNLHLNLFKFGIIKPNPQMKEIGLDISIEEAENFAGQMFDALIRKHRQGKRAIEANIRARIVNLFTRKTFDICLSRGCMGGRKMVSIDQKGNIFTCELLDLKEEAFGSIYAGKSLSEQVADAEKTHPYFTPKWDSHCVSCPWHFFCRGGCTSAVRYKDGRYSGRIDEMACALNRILYERIVHLLLTEDELLKGFVANDDAIHFF